ncbi:MAG: glycosyltransferase [Acidimicrobiales bacterium]
MLLQKIDLVPEREVVAIHFARRRHRAGSPIASGSTPGTIVIPEDTQLTFDRYLSAFFESWWHEFTSLEDYRLSLVVKGDLVLSVFRQCGNGEIYQLDRRSVSNPTPAPVDVAIPRPDDGIAPGRLWFTLESESDVELVSAGWHTDQIPRRDVHLNVIFCTFNRQDYLAQVLRDIDSADHVVDRVSRFTVVNQGSPFSLHEIGGADLSTNFVGKLEILEQPNLGGCGGFTRGLLETSRDSELDHFVLLDDDIRIDPDSLSRVWAFLSFAHDGVAVGGHMLDLDEPTSLYEAGADIDAATLEPKPILQGEPLGDNKILEKFLAPRTCNYNGWWFFAGSEAILERHGLPMPCFIRGDDIEYGVRLEREGTQTAAVPGIAVWHEPFYLKLGGWQLYFEVRNRLAMASIHGIGSWNAMRLSLTKTFIRDLVFSRYHSCTFMIQALEDFLAGPDSCFTTTPDALARCLEVHKELGPTRVDNSLPTRRPERGPLLGPGRKLAVKVSKGPQLASVMATRLRTGPTKIDEQPYAPGSMRIVDIAQLASYQVREGDGSTWRYDYRRDIESPLASRFMALIRQLGASEDIADAAPRGEHSWFEFWDETFPVGSDPVALAE